jgi:hypothetical protein
MSSSVYLFSILRVPEFIADDYYIFYLVQSHPSSIVSLNFDDKYLLFLRPVAYFFFWAQYHLFASNAFQMKLCSLLFGQMYVIAAITAAKYVVRFFHGTSSNTILLFAGLFISLHPDTLMSILWISDVNEVLMSLFYALALVVFFAFRRDDLHSPFLAISLLVILYILSLSSKQQSMHLPLLFLFLLWAFRDKFNLQKSRTLLLASLICLIVFVVALILNVKMYLLYPSDDSISIVSQLAKKPFSLLGDMAIIFFPWGGSGIYDYFIQNRLFALLLFMLIALLSVTFLSRWKSYTTHVFRTILFVTIVFVPRIIAPGGDRLNTVHVFLMVTLFLVLLHGVPRLALVVLCGLVIGAVAGSVAKVSLLEDTVRNHGALCESLNSLDKKEKRIKYVAYFSGRIPTSHSYYFYEHNTFGEDTLLMHSGLVVGDYRDWLYIPRDVRCSIANDTLTIESNVSQTDIYWDHDFHPLILQKEKGKIRGFSRIRLLVPEMVYRKKVLYLAPMDSTWRALR